MNTVLVPEPKFFLNPDVEIENYSRVYKGYNKQLIYGEKSTSYFTSELAAKNIVRYFPSAKILILLRNPLERAISHYFFSRFHGLETRTPREVFLENLPEPPYPETLSKNPFKYVEHSKYNKYLPIWQKHFPAQQLKVVILEDFSKNEVQVFEEVLDFLGVNDFNYNLQFNVYNQIVRDINVPQKVVDLLRLKFLEND